jgi:hypothetical protein
MNPWGMLKLIPIQTLQASTHELGYSYFLYSSVFYIENTCSFLRLSRKHLWELRICCRNPKDSNLTLVEIRALIDCTRQALAADSCSSSCSSSLLLHSMLLVSSTCRKKLSAQKINSK